MKTIKCLKKVKENNFEVLKIVNGDGMDLQCPIKQPQPIQNQLGSVGFIHHSCTSQCIFFNISLKDGDFPYFSCLNSNMEEELTLIYDDKSSNLELKLTDL